MDSPPAADPVELPMVDLLALADAISLLDRLALLVTLRHGGDRTTVIFGILEELQQYLDSVPDVRGPRGVCGIVDAVRAWFAMRIADEESGAREAPQ